MASAEQASPGITLPPIVESFNKLEPRQRLLGMVGAALLIALIVVAYLWSRQPDYTVLFTNLGERDGGEIVTVLQQQNIPYTFNNNGNAILVPSNVVHDTRLKLASQGLPKGGLVGFELMENQKLGISQFAEQINYQRGLEGELSRSVQSIAALRGARVHLAIPKQTAFLRDEQKPSASVLVSLYPGRVLEPQQVAGIVHLVSSSVPQLNPLNVSVIDQEGNLISQKKNPLEEAGLDPSQLKYVREIENTYIKRIEEIVGTVVGASNVRARVAVDVDFSSNEQVAETYRPNPTPESAIRSQQTAETGSTAPGAQGVPGALTNQPPAPATAPLTTPPVPGGAPGAPGTQAAQPFTKNATINYEVDKTVRHTKSAPGEIRRLSAAVVINHKLDDKGKSVPLSATEIKQITDLAREAMGFSSQRGDTLNVANANFSPTEREALPEIPLWKDPEAVSLGKEVIKYLLIAVLAWLVWARMIRPTLDRLAEANRTKPVEPTASIMIDGEMVEVDTQAAFERKLEGAKEMARQDPKMVASVIKEWVGGNEPR